MSEIFFLIHLNEINFQRQRMDQKWIDPLIETYYDDSIQGASRGDILFPHSLIQLVENSFQIEFDFFRCH